MGGGVEARAVTRCTFDISPEMESILATLTTDRGTFGQLRDGCRDPFLNLLDRASFPKNQT